MGDATTAPAATLSEDHAAYLAEHAIDLDLARSLGVRTVAELEDREPLGEPWAMFRTLPAIAFPWTAPDGRVEWQLRPDNPTTDQRGRLRKYMFRPGMTPVLWEVRPGAAGSAMLIVEGTKQCLAAASHAPEGMAVYGIAGCRMWQDEGTPIPDLAVAEDREVVVILDADATTNRDVYDAGTGLAAALAMEGASKITFARLPGGGKAGLDDVLAGREHERRASYLARLISGAKPKPADKAPTAKKKLKDPPAAGNRVTLVCNRDRWEVINDLTKSLLEKWNGTGLFNHGGVISKLGGKGMVPIDAGTVRDIIQATCLTVDETDGANGVTYSFTWPDPNTIKAMLSRAEHFAPLERVAHAPYVRLDGSVVTKPGYDEATKTMLILDPELEGIEVPEAPTPEEVAAALELVMTEWLGDFPFDTDADRANMLALALTPAIRGLVPRVPLAVVDGLQMGVGKNKIADTLLLVYTGQAAKPMNFVDEVEELRKQITSAFRTGAEFFVFDEAHVVAGAALAQALTAETWQDRILGVSTMAEFPNRVTWVSLGNNVSVQGDLTRRVYRIAIRPRYANPQDRPASSFRHPGVSGYDLETWVAANRKGLLTALLTLVRAWFAAGQPRPARGVSFGSFEGWERVVGGIVETAGLTGFLDNLKVWRSESDFDTQYWSNHVAWLRDQFQDRPFRTAEVKAAAQVDLPSYMAPPRLDDVADKGYTKALGEQYSRIRGRRYGGLYLDRAGSAHGHVSLWTVCRDGDTGPDTPPPPVEPEEVPPPATVTPVKTDTGAIIHGGAPGLLGEMEAALAEEGLDSSGDLLAELEPDTGVSIQPDRKDGLQFTGELAEVVTFDLETHSADDLHRHGPGYSRLSGWSTDAGPVLLEEGTAGPELIAESMRWAKVANGHNIMAFDLPALVREGVLTMEQVHEMARDGRVFDGLLVGRYLDPPMARDKGVDQKRRYDLGSMATKYGLVEKLSDVSAELAKKYGGWGAIPTGTDTEDGRRFREYAGRDVEVSRDLRVKLLEELGGELPPYLVREHRVAAIAAQISYNGFLVDSERVAGAIEQIEARKAKATQYLVGRWGLPTMTADGKTPAKNILGTNGGKKALEGALREAGATSIWHTENTGYIDISADHMRHLWHEYWHLADVRRIAKAVHMIVGARSVYETARACTAPDGRVHPKIGFEQATGRWSLTQPGLTVFGKRGGRHVERMIFLPDPGEVILAVDLSQVDMRGVAALSQDQAYIEMLRYEDPHAEIALALFGDRKLREVAKPIGHGWNYGRGIPAISNGEDIDIDLVRQFDTQMRERFPRMVEWRDEVRALAESGVLLDNGFGRLMRPDPRRAYTQGPALMGQGAARDIMMTGLLVVADKHPEVLPMLRAQVHDEVVLSVPADIAEDVRRAVVDAFTWEWRGVPITADSSPLGQTWGHCYEKG